MTLRIFTGLSLVIAAYVVLAFEATTGGRTLLPHGPAMLLVLAAWWLPALPAVLVGAAIGFACDAIGTGSLGPGMIAAVLAAAISGGLRRRWELESLLAVVLFGMAVALAFLAGASVVAMAIAATPATSPALALCAARSMTSAFASVAIVALARFTARVTSGFTAILLSH